MPDKVYIVLDNYGFPRFADPECQRLYMFIDLEQAQEYARLMAKENPNTIVTIFERIMSVYDDGREIRTIGEQATA